jgi:Anti-sigma factor NepR
MLMNSARRWSEHEIVFRGAWNQKRARTLIRLGLRDPGKLRAMNQSMSKAKPTDGDEPQADPKLDARAIGAIGRALRAHYDDLVTSPLPDRFNELIAKLGSDDRPAQKDETGPEGRANAAG